MAIIEGVNLEKKYPDGTHALKGASLSIERGEFVAIMGPSGSGKSTLLHILGLLDPATSGKYTLSSKQVSNLTKSELAHLRNEKIGFVFQIFNLLGRTSALENVKLPFLYSQIDESLWNKKAKKALEVVGLSHRESYEPAKLSGGERQRVAIARALITNPEIVFADEPTGNLDSKSGEAIMDILGKLHKEGKTIVLVTHERSIAEHANRIIYIKDGLIFSDTKVEKK